MNIKKTIGTIIVGGVLLAAGYLKGNNDGAQTEAEKHKDDEITIGVDYYGKNGQRINVFGSLRGEHFGLLDVGEYYHIRSKLWKQVPDSLDTEQFFKTLDSLMNNAVEKDLHRYPYTGNHFVANSYTSFDFSTTITAGPEK